MLYVLDVNLCRWFYRISYAFRTLFYILVISLLNHFAIAIERYFRKCALDTCFQFYMEKSDKSQQGTKWKNWDSQRMYISRKWCVHPTFHIPSAIYSKSIQSIRNPMHFVISFSGCYVFFFCLVVCLPSNDMLCSVLLLTQISNSDAIYIWTSFKKRLKHTYTHTHTHT